MKPSHASSNDSSTSSAVRIDKWLWAARFYRTRTLAKEAIEGGKVHFQGERVKVSKEIRVGMELTIRQGFDEKTVQIASLSVMRGNATAAQHLYQETEASIARRELMNAARKLSNQARPDHRPNKHERQQLQRFQQNSTRDHSFDEGF
ncbi:RNA-binding S4 domain-containing protein [Aquirhabdus sp.]|uniref:RNA-binding S4 domain-containing protein n=1 Tax=Aquirhabdus sp. TaxID=2824160 RepID=UPI00396C9E5D